jgi:class 3 adenylate cyclase/Tfp pilus assembly protein PilF
MGMQTNHPEKRVVVLFTDISGYTEYVSTRGNIAAIELLNRHNALLRPVIEQYGGNFVKSTGDGLIAYFERPKEAVDAAVVIQQRLAAFNLERRENEEIHVRAALHEGTAVVEESEIIGSAVNIAARLVAACKRDQILISGDLYKKVRRARHLSFKKVGHVQLKGVPSVQDAHEVCWQLENFEEKKKFAFLESKGRAWARLGPALVMAVLVVTASAVGYILVKRARTPNSTPLLLHTSSSEAKELYLLARDYQLRGDDEQSVAALEQAIAIDGNFAEAHLELGFLFYDMRELDSADQHVQKVEAMSESLPENLQLKARGLRALTSGDSMQAAQLFRLLADRYPKDTDALYYLAEAETDVGRLDQAELALESCLRVDGSNPYCNYQLMMLQVRSNEFDNVVQTHRSRQERGVKYIWLEEPMGLALWGKESIDLAAQRFSALAAAKPGEVKAHGTIHFRTAKGWLADLKAYKGDMQGAVDQLERLLSEEVSEDTRLDGLVYVAQLQETMGDNSRTISRTRGLLSGHGDLKVSFHTARALASLGETSELTRLLRESQLDQKTKLAGDPAHGHFLRGVVAFREGRLRDAEAELSLSYQLDNDINTLVLVIQTQIAQEKWESGAKLAEELLENKGRILADYPPSLWGLGHYYLAECNYQLGYTDRAVEYYTRFLEVWSEADPKIPPVKNARDRLALLQQAGR